MTTASQFTARFRDLINCNYGTWRGWVRHQLGLADLLAGRLGPHASVAMCGPVLRVIFVCHGNINRSAFAHAIALREGMACCSLGLATTTGAPAFDQARTTAAAMGVDLNDHQATSFNDHGVREGDLYVAMEVRHVNRLASLGVSRERIVLLGIWGAPRRVHLHDPHTLSADYFVTCFTIIRSAVQRLAQDLRRHGSPCMSP
jgi:protein-tyrosine phosphatase